MRHGVKTKKLGRDRAHRKAMLNNLATSILLKGLEEEQMSRQVRTTVQKAKAVRSLVERLITYAKKGDLSAKRQAARFVKDKDVFKGLFSTLGERYQGRNGGYTRILKLSSNRHGDNAEMAVISLVEDEVVAKPKKKTKKVAAKPKAAPKVDAVEETKAPETEVVQEAAAEDAK
jgi:large subunit ribosomal protein L17